MNVKEQIETALGSASRVKVIACLARDPNKWQSEYSIAQYAKLNKTRSKVMTNYLVRCGWLEAIEQPVRKFRINVSNPLALAFVEFLRQAQYLDEV